MLASPKSMNPDEDFVLHGCAAPYWEKSGYYGNSKLTNTTARLSQHARYAPNNYRERKHAKTLSDLADNLEYVSEKVDHTINERYLPEVEQIKPNTEIVPRPELPVSLNDASKHSLHESLRTDLSDDELLKLYEKKVERLDSNGISGKPVSPRDSQWYVNPNHLTTTSEVPTFQSVGQTFRKGEKIASRYSDKDNVALRYFPVTLGSAYEFCAEGFPEAKPMLSTAPPSMRQSRPRSKSASRHWESQISRKRDKFDAKQDLEKLYLTTAEAPYIGSGGLFFTSPYQMSLGKLRLQRLQLEEAKLLELKRIEELERTRGPKPKWYASKGPDFHYESHKNTELIKWESQYQDLLDYREDLLRASYENLKQYTRRLD